jgi:hypothetical protein
MILGLLVQEPTKNGLKARERITGRERLYGGTPYRKSKLSLLQFSC